MTLFSIYPTATCFYNFVLQSFIALLRLERCRVCCRGGCREHRHHHLATFDFRALLGLLTFD